MEYFIPDEIVLHPTKEAFRVGVIFSIMKTADSDSYSTITFSVVILILTAGYRVLRAAYFPEIPNFSPLMAMAFCGGLFLPWKMAFGVVLGALAVSDLWIGLVLGTGGLGIPLLINYAMFSIAIGFGMVLRHREFRLRYFFGGVLLNAIIFYLVTNTGAWLANPQYVKSIAGWIQALTVGIPGYPPTWIFFRNSLFSDLFFSCIFAGAWLLTRGGSKLPAKSQTSAGCSRSKKLV